MDDKSALLRSLKIEREPLSPESTGTARWLILVPVVALLIGAAWWMLKADAPIAIQTTTARLIGGPGASSVSVLDASGYVVARRQATVSSKLTGKVMELMIEEGSRVEAGQVLARIDDTNIRTQLELSRSQLDAARAQLTEVQVQLAEAERTLRRARELADRKLVSQAALDTAQAEVDSQRARLRSTQLNVTVAERGVAVQAQQLEDAVVRAPFSGVITVKNAQPGEMISPLSAGGAGTRTGIGTLVDMDSLEVEVDVNENFINRVQDGQRAETTLNAYPDWKIPSTVIAVIPTADRSKATVKVRIGLSIKDPRVIPDMGARVSFLPVEQTTAADTAAAAQVLIAASAVQRQQDQDVVFVVRDETVERRVVKLGDQRDQDVVVIEGLQGSERVANSALDQLADGARISLGEK